MEHVAEPVQHIHEALGKVTGAEAMEIVFLYLLDAGNFINAGTFNGNAQGFTIDTLEKLRDVKTNDETFLHVMVDDIRSQQPQVFDAIKGLNCLMSELPEKVSVLPMPMAVPMLLAVGDPIGDLIN
jgi:hypothetical protein